MLLFIKIVHAHYQKVPLEEYKEENKNDLEP